MWPQELLVESTSQRLALTLLHFLWQGALVAAIYAIVVEWLVRRPSRRYAAGVTALVVMAACLPITYCLVEPPPNWLTTRAPLTEQILPLPDRHAMAASGDNFKNGELIETQIEPAVIAHDHSAAGEAAAIAPQDSVWREELYRRIVLAWLCGVTVFSLRLLSGAVGLWSLTRRTSPASDGVAQRMARPSCTMR